MRQTNLTAEEIIIRLERNDSQYPTCFYVNELGEMAQKGDVTAECALIQFLDSDAGENERAAAYIHLTLARWFTGPETGKALDEFAKRPENAGIVAWAQSTLTRLKTSVGAH